MRGKVRGSQKSVGVILQEPWMSVHYFVLIHPVDVLQDKWKLWPAGGARGWVKVSAKSLGFIHCGPRISVQHFMAIHNEIFKSQCASCSKHKSKVTESGMICSANFSLLYRYVFFYYYYISVTIKDLLKNLQTQFISMPPLEHLSATQVLKAHNQTHDSCSSWNVWIRIVD